MIEYIFEVSMYVILLSSLIPGATVTWSQRYHYDVWCNLTVRPFISHTTMLLLTWDQSFFTETKRWRYTCLIPALRPHALSWLSQNFCL